MGCCCAKLSPLHLSESIDAKRSIANEPKLICPRLSRIKSHPSLPTVTGPRFEKLITASDVLKACGLEPLDPTKVSSDEARCFEPWEGPGIMEEECPALVSDEDSDPDPDIRETKPGDAFLDPEVGSFKAVCSYQEFGGSSPHLDLQLEVNKTSTSGPSAASHILSAPTISQVDNTTNKWKSSDLKNLRDIMLKSGVWRSTFSEDLSRSLCSVHLAGFQPWTGAGIMEETCPPLYDEEDDVYVYQVQHGGIAQPLSLTGLELVGPMTGFSPWTGAGISEETCPQLVSDDDDDVDVTAYEEEYERGTHELAIAMLKEGPRLRNPNWVSWKETFCLDTSPSPTDSLKPKGTMSALDLEIEALETEVFGETMSGPEYSEASKKHDDKLSELEISEEICPDLINVEELDPGPESIFCAQDRRIELLSQLDRIRAQIISEELNYRIGAPRGITHPYSAIIPILEDLTDEIWKEQTNRRLPPRLEPSHDHEQTQQSFVTSQDSRTALQSAGDDTPTPQQPQVTAASNNRRRRPKGSCKKALNAFFKLFKY